MMRTPRHSTAVPSTPIAQQMVAAEVSLALASRRLEALRLGALLGEDYDPDAFDAAVVAHRKACAAVAATLQLSGAPAAQLSHLS